MLNYTHEEFIMILCNEINSDLENLEDCPTFESLYKIYFDSLCIEYKEDRDCVLLLGEALVRVLYSKCE